MIHADTSGPHSRVTSIGVDRMSPLRLAILGCGTIARDTHLPAFRAAGPERVDVTVFASRSASSAAAAAAEWGGGATVTDWQDVLTRDDVDAVDICAPNALHAQMAIQAAEAGKHVLVEKPMATSLAQAAAMIAAAQAAGVVLMPAHNLRFAPRSLAAAQLVAAGQLGEIVGVRASLEHTGPQDWAPGADWFFDSGQAGGGALLDLGVHLVDLIRAVTGDELDEVTALTRPRPGCAGIENAAEVGFRLAGGAAGSLRASWETTPAAGMGLTLAGTEGTLTVGAGTAVLRDARGSAREVAVPAAVNPYALFADACAGRVPPPVTGRDGQAALAGVLAAYAAAAGRRTVSVPQFVRDGLARGPEPGLLRR
ncbi:MAG TPA: Gfo/Idh/MocA family oxidoreductase [Streptosporangiaceae bacterium]